MTCKSIHVHVHACAGIACVHKLGSVSKDSANSVVTVTTDRQLRRERFDR